MVKVKCIKCGTIGFTAAPNYVRCSECGGRHRIIPFRKSELHSPKYDNRILSFYLAKQG